MFFYFIIILFSSIILTLERKQKLPPWLNSIIFAYGLGISLSLLKFDKSTIAIKDIISLSVVMAIASMLLNTNLKDAWQKGRSLLVASLVFFISTSFMCYTLGVLFSISPDIPALTTGLYTGSVPNMGFIAQYLHIPTERFLTLQAIDLILCGGFSFILLSPLAQKFFALIPVRNSNTQIKVVHYEENANKAPIALRRQLKDLFFILIILFIILSLCAFASHLIFAKMEQLFILTSLTLVSVLLSLNPKIRKNEKASLLGDFFLILFCLCVGSLLNFSKLSNAPFEIIVFLTCSFFLSIFLQQIWCRLLKLSRLDCMISMTAGIYSPAFIVPLLKAQKRKDLLLPAMTTGLIGLALGNYLGLLVYWLLK